MTSTIEQIRRSFLATRGTLNLSADDADGHWVTIEGEHVFIKGGRIDKGPAGIVGKKIGDLPARSKPHQKLGHDEASYHRAKLQAKASPKSSGHSGHLFDDKADSSGKTGSLFDQNKARESFKAAHGKPKLIPGDKSGIAHALTRPPPEGMSPAAYAQEAKAMGIIHHGNGIPHEEALRMGEDSVHEMRAKAKAINERNAAASPARESFKAAHGEKAKSAATGKLAPVSADTLEPLGSDPDSVRNPLVPDSVKLTGRKNDDHEAVTEHVADHHAAIADKLMDATKDAPGQVRAVPIDSIDTQQPTLSKKALGKYLNSTGWEKEAGVAVKNGNRHVLVDGNHRVVAQKLKGAKTVNIRIIGEDRFDAGPASAVTPGIFGQSTVAAGTGKQGAMFDTAKPVDAGRIGGSKSALDPKHTAKMDFEPNHKPGALDMNKEQFHAYREKWNATLVDRNGKAYAKKYWNATDRMFPASDVVEYRHAGVVTKQGDGFSLHILGDTDSPADKWRDAGVIDVTDQFPRREAKFSADQPTLNLARESFLRSRTHAARAAFLATRTAPATHNLSCFTDDAGTLHLSVATPSAVREVPGALLGLPTEIMGQRVMHAWKDLIPSGQYVHPTKDFRVDATPGRINHWVRTFQQMKRDGIEVFVPNDHSKKANQNNGWVIDMKREGGTLMGLCQFIGEDAIRNAARNRVSIGIAPALKGGNGKVYPDAIEHVALTACPVVGGQSAFMVA